MYLGIDGGGTKTALCLLDEDGRVVAEAQALAPGTVVVLFQPRLRVEVSGWLIRGDVDLLRL